MKSATNMQADKPKTNKNKCFKCTSVPFCPDQAFLGIMNYLCKVLLAHVDMWNVRNLTSARTEWPWNETYQKIFDKAKSIIIEEACMKFCDENKPLYKELDASGVWLGAALLHIRGTRQHYSQTHCICKQEFVNHRKEIQQHRIRSTRYTMWTWEHPSLLLYEWGKYNYISQTANYNI